MFHKDDKAKLDYNIKVQMELEELWEQLAGRPIMRGMVYKDPLSRFAIVAVSLVEWSKRTLLDV